VSGVQMFARANVLPSLGPFGMLIVKPNVKQLLRKTRIKARAVLLFISKIQYFPGKTGAILGPSCATDVSVFMYVSV